LVDAAILRLSIDLLGPLRLLRNGEDVAMPTPKERLILGLLAVQAPHPVPFATLADAVWPEATSENWRKALQLHVFRLRKRLALDGVDGSSQHGHDTIVTIGDSYALTVDPKAIDLHRFEDQIGLGRRHVAEGRPSEGVRELGEALRLWRADPLVDLAGTPIGDAQIARLSELRLAAIEEHHEAELALGRHEQLVPRLEAEVVEHPLRERFWRLLMIALYRSGRQSDALRAYQRARSHLIDEIGLEPGRDLRRIEAAIVAQDPDLDWVAPAAATSRRSTDPPRDDAIPRWVARLRDVPFRGRTHEMNVVRSAWRSVATDGLQIVSVAGPAGVGKSRLLAEVAVECAADGGSVDACRCTPDADHPNGSLLGLASAGETERRAPQSTSELVGWVQNRTSDGPSALLVDDVGSADPDTLEALSTVLRLCDDLPLLVVVTQRLPDRVAGHVDDFLLEASRHSGHRRIDLTGLDMADGVSMISTQLGRADDGTPLDLATLVHEAAGNPRYMLELANHAIEQASVHPNGQITVDSVMGTLGVPASLRSLVRRRCALLDDGARVVLGAAAVLGSTFDFRMVAQVVDRSEEAVVEALEGAAAVGLVKDSSDAGEVAFTSIVVRACIYRDLTSPRRAFLHQRAGEVLASADAAPVSMRLPVVIDHFARGQSALRADVREGRSDQFGAERLRPAYEAAVSCFEASLVDTGGSVEDQHCGLLLGLATGRWRSGDLGAARELFQRAADDARALQRPDLMARAACGLAQVVLEVGVTHPPVMSLLEDSQRLLDADHPLQQQIRAAIVPELVWAGRWAEAVQVARALGAEHRER
jgi:DNA-binding SARP family transcriptional activator